MILQNLVYLPMIALTLTFVYNALLGIVQVVQSLSAKTRQHAIQKLLWTNFLFSCYHFCYDSQWFSELCLLLLDLKPRKGNAINGFSQYALSAQTSHTVCVFLGVIASQGMLHLISLLASRYKKLDKGGELFLESFLAIVLHTEFFFGTYLWFRYCFSASPIQPGDIWILATSHTLAFSIGTFVVKDFLTRRETVKETTLVRSYSYCALISLVLRAALVLLFAWIGLPSPSALVVVCSISLLLLILLPSKALSFYAIPPSLVLSLVIVTNIGDDLSWIKSVGWICLGIWIGICMKTGDTTRVTDLNGDRLHRAAKYPSPFPNGWYRMMSSDDLKPLDVVQVKALGRQFAIMRGESMKVSVSDAFCPHLGANLALGGRVRGDELQCPFHEWRFDQSGTCTYIPESKVPLNAKLRTFETVEYMGSIYIFYHVKMEEPTYFPLKDDLFDAGLLKSYGQSTTQMYLHPQDVAENSADFAHFNIVHGKLHVPILSHFTYVRHNINVIKTDSKPHLLTFENKALIYSIFNDDEPFLPDNTSTVVQILGPSTVMYFRIFTPLGVVLIVKTFLPHRALECDMVDHYYAQKSVPYLLAQYVFREAKFAFMEDGVIWNHKTYPEHPILVKDDKTIKEFRRYYSQFYSEEDNVQKCSKMTGLDW